MRAVIGMLVLGISLLSGCRYPDEEKIPDVKLQINTAFVPEKVARLEKKADAVVIGYPLKTVLTGRTFDLNKEMRLDATRTELKTRFLRIAGLKGELADEFDVLHHRLTDNKEWSQLFSPRFVEFRLGQADLKVHNRDRKTDDRVLLDTPAYLLYLVKDKSGAYTTVTDWQEEEDSVYEVSVPWSHRVHPPKLDK